MKGTGAQRAARDYLYLTLASDFLLANLSFVATSLVRFGTLYPTDSFLPIYLQLQVFLNLVLPLAHLLSGAYRDGYRATLGHQASSSAKACLWAAASTLATLYLLRHLGYSRVFVVAHLVQVTIILPFSRIPLSRIAEAWRARGKGVRPVVLAGERDAVAEVGLHLRHASHLGYRLAGVYPIGWEPAADELDPVAVVADREALKRLVASERIERIFVCDRRVDPRRWKPLVETAKELGVDIRLVVCPVVVPDFRTRIHDILAVPLADPLSGPSEPTQSRIKRAADIVLAGTLLAVLSPAFAFIAALIKLGSPGPVLYRQTRLGLGGRTFSMLKFRSMISNADEERARLEGANEASGPLFKMRRDPRVTAAGQWLRKFSLDELPQLWNVLVGDLSLVGPRPPIPEEVARYAGWQRFRLSAPQGLTGLWQVSGRSRLSFEEMVLLDLYYIEHWSPLLDVEILMETLPTILHGDGAF